MTVAQFDVVVVGGGIHGCGIARELALRGISTLLVEKSDFGSETTSASTRLIHGGLRYLETGEIGLVREALRERENLLGNAPHLVRSVEIAIPIYRSSSRGTSTVRAGMIGYDLLSMGKSAPRHRMLSRHEGIELLPGVVADGLLGVAVYQDAHAQYAERLCIENVIDAQRHGAVVLNHVNVSALSVVDEKIESVHLTDTLTGSVREVRPRVVVNATGPWAGELAGLAGLGESGWLSARKGSHVVVRNIKGVPEPLLHFESIVDRRGLIIVPWLGMHVIGSTEVSLVGSPSDARIGDDEIEYMIESVNGVLPGAGLTVDDVCFTYSGVRPLAFDPRGGSGKTSRRHRIIDHGSVGGTTGRAEGLVTLVGGKLTTFRATSSQVADHIDRKLRSGGRRVDTSRLSLPGGDTDVIESLPKWFPHWHSIPSEVTTRLMSIYGSRVGVLGDLIHRDVALADPIGPATGPLKAEVVHGFESEMARTLVDLLVRRMMTAWTPSLGLDRVREFAEVARQYLGWSEQRTADEVEGYRLFVSKFRPLAEQSATAPESSVQSVSG